MCRHSITVQRLLTISKKSSYSFFRLIWDNQFDAGDEMVGVGKVVSIDGDYFTPLIRGAVVFGGNRREGFALLDDVDSLL